MEKGMKEIIDSAYEKMPDDKYHDFLSILRNKAAKGLIRESSAELEEIIRTVERVDNNVDVELMQLLTEMDDAIKKYDGVYEIIEEHELEAYKNEE